MDTQLASFASVRQLEILEAIEAANGSIRGAARALKLDPKTVRHHMDRLKIKAASKGYSPGHAGLAGDQLSPVERLKGRSIYLDVKSGQAEKVWIKTDVDAEKRDQLMREVIEALKEEIPRLTALPAPQASLNEKLCNCFVITDFHLNALSWKEETGANWDVDIAERTLVAWFAQAIAMSPNAETAIFAQISDLLHSDGLEPLTPASKHVLDVDTRFQKVVRIVIRVLRQVIDMLLAKHQRVHILMADANHDPVSQIWLREWLTVLYENEPRITVDRSPSPYNAFEFGKVALFFHHGHKRKIANVSEVFAAKFREMYGRTKYAYVHMGHLHHLDVKENAMMVVEQHRTLTAPDAYAARGGYLSGRDAQVITYHKDFGEVSRVKVSYEMLCETAGSA
jgi:hypothetical protein